MPWMSWQLPVLAARDRKSKVPGRRDKKGFGGKDVKIGVRARMILKVEDKGLRVRVKKKINLRISSGLVLELG